MKIVVILFACILVVLTNRAFATEQQHHKAKTVTAAGGHDEKGAKQNEVKHVKKSEHTSKHDVEKAQKGQSGKEVHKKAHEEGGGKKTKHHEEDGHQSYHGEQGGSAHGAKFQEGAKKKKHNYKKGFREKYHKDEEKKHNTFYSNSHKSGEFEVYGQKHSKFNSKFAAKKKVENEKSGGDQKNYKKASADAGGHESGDHKGHKDQKATKSHHNHQDKWAKKGGNKGGKQYKYKVAHHK